MSEIFVTESLHVDKIGAVEYKYSYDEIRIEPKALTAPEAGYLVGFKNADTLRDRAAKARQERSSRLRSKEIRISKGEVSFQVEQALYKKRD